MIAQIASVWFARLAGVIAWLAPAAWFLLLVRGLLGAQEYAAISKCGNPLLGLYLLALLSWPLLWGITAVGAWLVCLKVGTAVATAERPLRYAWLACPAFIVLFIAAAIIITFS